MRELGQQNPVEGRVGRSRGSYILTDGLSLSIRFRCLPPHVFSPGQVGPSYTFTTKYIAWAGVRAPAGTVLEAGRMVRLRCLWRSFGGCAGRSIRCHPSGDPLVRVGELRAKGEPSCSLSKVTALLLEMLPSPRGPHGTPAWQWEREMRVSPRGSVPSP